MTFPAPTHDSLSARAERLAHPGYSHCLRCGRPWACVERHSTWYRGHESRGGGRACFPLCESCWTMLGCAEARIEYYGTLIAYWAETSPGAPDDEDEVTLRRDIGRAVAAGG